MLSSQGHAQFTATFYTPGSDLHPIVGISIYQHLRDFSQVEQVLNATESTPAFDALATGSATFSSCTPTAHQTLFVDLDASAPVSAGSASKCGEASVHLDLHCSQASCDGVYPVRYSVAGSTRPLWSLVTVEASKVATSLAVSFIGEVLPSSLTHVHASVAALNAIASLRTSPLSLTADYQTLAQISKSVALRNAYVRALRTPLHQLLNAPPGDIDFGGLEAAGFASQATTQLNLGDSLGRSLTGRYVDTPIALSGTPSSASLVAITEANAAKQTDVVLPESDLSTPPSQTLTWGTPFHVEGVNGLSALAINAPLSQALTSGSLSDGQRAAIELGALAFLHFEAPSDSALRSIVLEAPIASLSPTFISDFFGGLSHFSYATASPIAPLFSASYVGTSSAPVYETLAQRPVSVWSSTNIETLNQLINSTTSFTNAITSSPTVTSLQVAIANAEIVGTPNQRQEKINQATNALNGQLNNFSIDSGAITLAGSGTQLPVTILSKANYSVTVVVHLITNRLTFPKGSSIVTTLNSSTKSLRIPTAKASGSDLTLQVVVTTPDGLVVLTKSAIQVRIAGTSVIGYILSIASLLVLAAWWLRTYRRRSKGRRAR